MKRFKRILNSLYLGIRRIVSLLLITPITVTLHCWLHIFQNVSSSQVYLNLGSQFLKAGAGIKVGDPRHIPVGRNPDGTTKTKLMYLKNIYYNFNQNRITTTHTDRPHKLRAKDESRR